MAESPTPIAEIDHGPSKFDQFLDKHTQKIIILAILIALGVIAYVIYAGLDQAKAEEAGAAVTSAQDTSDYQEVIKNWPDTKSAESAQLLLANVQWDDSQADSIQTLRDFISANSKHPALATAKTSLGLRLIAQGNNSEAVTILNEVADDENASYIAPLAQISLGDLAKAAGDTTQAKTWYEKALSDPTGEGNTYADTAKARLDLVNAKPPTKIKPAPPEPVVPTPAPPAPVVPAGSSIPAADQAEETANDSNKAP